MNVLLIESTDFPDGGASTQHAKLMLQGFRANGIKAYLLIPNATHIVDSNKQKKGHIESVPFFYIGSSKRSENKILAGIETATSSWKIFCFLLKRKLKGRHDAVLLGDRRFLRIFPIVLAARIFGIPLFAWIVELESSAFSPGCNNLAELIKKASICLYERLIPVFANGLIVISSALYTIYSRRIADNRILLSPILVNPYNFLNQNNCNMPDWIEEIQAKRWIVYSGTFGEKDGVSCIIEAFSLIAGEYPDALLILAGSPSGSSKNRIKRGIEKQLEQLNLKDRVIITGYLPKRELELLSSKAAILLACRTNSPYANYGFPWKIGEYCMAERPILATNVSDVSLYFEDEVNLFICEPEDKDSIALKMMAILKNSEKAQSVAEQSRKVAIKEFNYIDQTRRMINFMTANS